LHVLQNIAIQADDSVHAFRSVKEGLEAKLGDDPYSDSNTWFDWFVTGGGRFSSSQDPYNDNYMDDVVKQDTPEFVERLTQSMTNRSTEMSEYLVSAEKIDYKALLVSFRGASSGDPDYRVMSDLYSIKKLYDMAGGLWDFNSYFYDMHNDSTSMQYMQKSIDNGDKTWYIVPVDFHF
jgi:hypothetical protein